MYPKVDGYGNWDVEDFETYYSRWPSSLKSIPKQVVEDWIYRHWHDFEERWINLKPHTWKYSLKVFSNQKILRIDHIGNWINELDKEGEEYVSDTPRANTRLAKYMLENGSFPVPIITAKSAGSITHPQSGGEFMKEPYQLIEGHSRLGCIRGMINSNHQSLLSEHQVWVVEIT